MAVNSINSPFQVRPNVFNILGIDVLSADVGNIVIDTIMFIPVSFQIGISRILIGYNSDLWTDMGLYLFKQSPLADFRNFFLENQERCNRFFSSESYGKS